MRVERELMRGAGPAAVLKLLEPGEMYGYELVSALGTRTDGVLAMGHSTLYPLLYNLEAKKLITSRWRRAESNRRRRYYSLTDRGRQRLAAERGQWKSLVRALTQIGVLPDTATASWLVESAQ
ncbi:MAG: PadR family transcriptional regulator [Phycisphaerales bacterium]